MKVKVVHWSETGNYRQSNQDYVGYSYNYSGDFLAIACDGMGGHVFGGVASKLSVNSFIDIFNNSNFNNYSQEDIINWLRDSVMNIKQSLKRYANNKKETTDMGTTLTALLIVQHLDSSFIVNIGDSRAYKVINNKLHKITQDQNLWNETTDREHQEYEQKHESMNMNNLTFWKILTSALGPTKNLKIDTYILKNPFGTYLLTTDGVHDYVDEKTIKEVLDLKKSPKAKVHKIVKIAKNNLSTDNLSIMLIEVFA